jgi:hypothetical protein
MKYDSLSVYCLRVRQNVRAFEGNRRRVFGKTRAVSLLVGTTNGMPQMGSVRHDGFGRAIE